jgi:hypothetical protein
MPQVLHVVLDNGFDWATAGLTAAIGLIGALIGAFAAVRQTTKTLKSDAETLKTTMANERRLASEARDHEQALASEDRAAIAGLEVARRHEDALIKLLESVEDAEMSLTDTMPVTGSGPRAPRYTRRSDPHARLAGFQNLRRTFRLYGQYASAPLRDAYESAVRMASAYDRLDEAADGRLKILRATLDLVAYFAYVRRVIVAELRAQPLQSAVAAPDVARHDENRWVAPGEPNPPEMIDPIL